MKRRDVFYVVILIAIAVFFIVISAITDAQSAEVQRVVNRAAELGEYQYTPSTTYTWPPKPNGVSEEYWNELKYNSRLNNGTYVCPDFSLYDWTGISYPGFGD